MGRYILTPEIFMFLEKQETGAGWEIQITDAIQKLNEIQRVFAYEFEGKRYDVGEKLGFIQTTIEFALKNEDLRVDLIKFMEHLLNEAKVKQK
jgi:UTP--glucose-1-phosphate uridylyltransferase